MWSLIIAVVVLLLLAVVVACGVVVVFSVRFVCFSFGFRPFVYLCPLHIACCLLARACVRAFGHVYVYVCATCVCVRQLSVLILRYCIPSPR